MKNKDIELPEVQEFLKVARTFVRQMDIIKKNKMPEQYKDVVDGAIKLVDESIEKYK